MYFWNTVNDDPFSHIHDEVHLLNSRMEHHLIYFDENI